MSSNVEKGQGQPSLEEELEKLLSKARAEGIDPEEVLAEMSEIVEKHRKPVRRSNNNSLGDSGMRDSGSGSQKGSSCGSSGCC